MEKSRKSVDFSAEFKMLKVLRKITITVLLSTILAITSLYIFDLDGVHSLHSKIPAQLQPFRPVPIRVANAIGKFLEHVDLLKVLLPLNEQQLISSACKQLNNVGNSVLECPLLEGSKDEEWRIGLRVLLDSLERDGSLTLFGRFFATQQIGDALKRRALVQQYWKTNHAWSKEIISRPIFIVGLPRTGTTFLQELLGQDPTLRTTKMWELMEPVPPPPSPLDVHALNATDVQTRIRNVQWNLDQYKRLSPGLDAYHPVHSLRPEECILTLASTFDSQQYSATYQVNSFNQWILEHKNHMYAMKWHKNVLQTFQSGAHADETKTQWVLKTPYYLALLDDIRATYPDALIVHTHRDPDQVLASAASVHTKTFGIVSDDVDLQRIGQDQVALQRAFLTRAMRTRKKWKSEKFPSAKTGFNVIDVHLKDLQIDTLAQVRRIFQELIGRELTKEGEASMKQWLKENKRDKHGSHKFRKEDFGIDVTGDTFFNEYAKFFSARGAAGSRVKDEEVEEDEIREEL